MTTFFLTGGMPTSVSALSLRVQELHARMKKFIDEKIVPRVSEIYAHVTDPDPKVRWSIPPLLEELKVSYCTHLFFLVSILALFLTPDTRS